MTKQVFLILCVEKDKVWLTLKVVAVGVVTLLCVLNADIKEVTVPVILHKLI